MALFPRTPRAPRLPDDVVSRMERFGRFEFDPAGTDIDASDVWGELQEPYLPFAQSDPEGFARALANAVLPAGGFALFGAARTVWNLVGSDFSSPAYDAVRMAALEFFRANGVPGNRLSADAGLRLRGSDEHPAQGTGYSSPYVNQSCPCAQPTAANASADTSRSSTDRWNE